MKKLLSAVALVLAACGGNDAKPDAPLPDGPAVDTQMLPPGCDYAEQHDTTNDDVSTPPGTPEPSGLTLATHAAICGTFDSSHFDGDITVDVDAYTITLAADADVLVRIKGAGAEAIELVGVDIYGNAPAFDQHLGSVTFYGDHGVTPVHLAAGMYELVPFALSSQAITASVAYTLEIEKDNPAARCTVLTTGGYPESHDGASNNGNDMIAYPMGGPAALTTSTADMAEPTLTMLAQTASQRFTGTAADITAADRYEDRDTFAFATLDDVNELTLHLSWTGAANLDFFVTEAGSPDAVIQSTTSTAGQETTMASVKRNTNYWLVVGAKAGGSGLPAAYSATVCAGYFPL